MSERLYEWAKTVSNTEIAYNAGYQKAVEDAIERVKQLYSREAVVTQYEVTEELRKLNK